MLVTTYEDIVFYLRMRRIQMDVSQPVFADMLDLSLSTLRKWEQGNHSPALPNLIKWMETAGCQLAIVPDEEQSPALLKILRDTMESQLDYAAINRNRRRKKRGGARNALKPMRPFHVTGVKHGIVRPAGKRQAAKKKHGSD